MAINDVDLIYMCVCENCFVLLFLCQPKSMQREKSIQNIFHILFVCQLKYKYVYMNLPICII